jgi:hypothetical protein
MRILWALVALCSLGSLCACEIVNPPAPTRPSPRPTTAALSIENFSINVHVHPQPRVNAYLYEPRFQLRETGGKSGATLEVIKFGGEELSGDCLGSVRVPPGETLETFHTGEVLQTWGYCALMSAGAAEAPELEVVVFFKDDAGGRADVRASARGSR